MYLINTECSKRMLSDLFKQFSEDVFSTIEKHLSSKYWKIKIIVFSVFLSLFFASPAYDLFFIGEGSKYWSEVMKQIDDPFQPRDYDPDSHASKLAFRLTPPLIAHFLGLNIVGCLIMQFIAFATLFYFVLQLTYKITQDTVATTLLIWAFAFIYPGNVLCSDMRGIFDVVAFCLLAICMFSRNSYVITLSSFFASFTDERALIASSLIFLWFLVRDTDFNYLRLKPFYKINKSVFALLLSWLIYYIARTLLSYFFHLKISTGGTNLFLQQIDILPFGIWTGIEGFWLLVISSFTIIIYRHRWSFLLAYTISLFTIIIVAMSVYDITRSMAYLFPSIFISLHIIKQDKSIFIIRRGLLTILLICLFPTYYVGDNILANVSYPLPLRLIVQLHHIVLEFILKIFHEILKSAL